MMFYKYFILISSTYRTLANANREKHLKIFTPFSILQTRIQYTRPAGFVLCRSHWLHLHPLIVEDASKNAMELHEMLNRICMNVVGLVELAQTQGLISILFSHAQIAP